MLSEECQNLLEESVRRGIIQAEQREAIRRLAAEETAPSGEVKKGFRPIMILYYAGALLILAAMGWLLGSQWEELGPIGTLAVSAFYAALFGAIGYLLQFRQGYPIAGGLLFTCMVGMVPLLVYSIEAVTGLWPEQPPGSYHDYYVWINGSWIVIELATIAAAFLVLRKIRFSFLVMPAAIALWFLSMDIAQIVSATPWISMETRSWVSIGIGGLTILIARLLEWREAAGEYTFWLHLAGLFSFWGGLTSMPSHGELGKAVYGLINIGLIAISLWWRRKTYLVFGAMGCLGYLGHLAFEVFPHTTLFPVLLTAIGLTLILGAVMFQKKRAAHRSTGIGPEHMK